MIRSACMAGVALMLIGGCKVRDGAEETEPVEIGPNAEGERPYTPEVPTADNLARGGYDEEDRAERQADRRAIEEADEQGRDRERTRDRAVDRVATRQDLQRALEDADRRIERIRTNQELSEGDEDDLDNLERRVREVRQDLDAVEEDADWDAESDQLRTRLKRIDRAIERMEENEA